MKLRKASWLLLLLPLFSGKCEKEGVNCHHYLYIKNTSADTIICASKFSKGSEPTVTCVLAGDKIAPGDEKAYNMRYCWEDELVNGRTTDYYIVDPKKYNHTAVYYPCDSIPFKNEVLKRFQATIDDLKNNNFVLTYR